MTAYFGALRAGLVAVPVNPGSTSAEMASVLGHNDAKVVVADDSTSHVVEEAVAADLAERGSALRSTTAVGDAIAARL